MNEEEKENMQNSIEKKYQNVTEKGILNNLTYAECLFILTPENKYCDEIKELSLLKICEIFEKLQKENEEWREAYQEEKDKQFELIQNTNNTIKTANIAIKDLQEKLKEVITVQKIKDKIEELNKKEQKLQNSISAEEREEYSDANISWNLMDINIKREVLQDLIEGRK